jgi:hypothetical protein
MLKRVLLWIFAVVITLSAAVFQRLTGPTHPKRVEYKIEDSTYTVKLPRSGESTTDCIVSLVLPDSADATLNFRRYPTSDDFTQVKFVKSDNGKFEALLPKMPAAGKLEYYIEINSSTENIPLFKEEPVIIRFKDPVPIWALIPHIFIMFFAMMFSNVAGLMAAFRVTSFKTYGLIAIALMFIGGFILGPIVQHYAFGQAWTGFPLGSDLTDNKTLIAFMAWVFAVSMNWKTSRPWATVFAAIITIVVFSIPHSLRGSELNYESGKVVTGFIMNFIQ